MALYAQDAWTFILDEVGFILWILLNQQATSKSTKEENWLISLFYILVTLVTYIVYHK